MDCPYCQTANPAQARYCLGCGRPLIGGRVCATCHTLLPAHARYCFHCGAIVVPPAVPAGPVAWTVPEATPVVAAPAPPVVPPAAGTPASLPAQAAPPSVVAPAPAVQPCVPVQAAAERSVPDMLTSLKNYLPDALYEPLERRPTQRNLVQVSEHLAALLRTTKTYLPRPVILAPQPPGQPAGGLYRGTFLFVDVSGFTPLSERLSKFGRAGAERITAIINDLFYDLVSVLFAHGGVLLKFGGDALLGLFAGNSDEELAEAAMHAVQAAMAMQGTMERFAAIEAGGETCALRIKCGISSGRYFAAHIGTPQSMAYVTIGHTVNDADRAEGHAKPGDVVVAQATHDLLAGRATLEPRDEGFFLVQQVPPLAGSTTFPSLDEPPPGSVEAQIGYLVERMDRLSPYLAAELLPRIVTNPGDVRIAPDHRPVTVMFANYLGVSDLIDAMGDTRPELITQHLNDYFVSMARIVERYEGTLGRMDQYSVGDRLVIFFGAPRTHEDDPVRAVYTALEMQEATRRHFAALQTPEGIFRFRQRIGINTGFLFAGNAGAADLRQEYTLMGDDINMAARLMSMAKWEEILISDKTQKRVAPFFETEDRGLLKVKGKEILIPTFQVKRRREEIGRTRGLASGETALVDRGDELLALQACGQRFLSGRGQIVTIIGDSGLGKSRISRELKSWLLGIEPGAEVTWLEGHALSFSERMSYWLAIQILRALLGMSAEASPDDVLFALWERGEELLGRETAREAVPFLAHLLDLPLHGEWERWVQELEPQVRQKQTFWAARELLTAAARRQPLVIALDDLHWADEASLALIEHLLAVADHAPVMFCLIFRQRHDKGCWRLRDRAAGSYTHRYTEVALQPFSEGNSRELLRLLLPGAEFQPAVEQTILAKTTGNPFYLEEVVRSLIADGVLVCDEERPGMWKVTSAAAEIVVPDTLQGAILARIDRLTEDARQALQMAAVIGRRFQTQVLSGLVQVEAELENWLAQLERSDLIRPAAYDPDPVYDFPDALVQEVAYDSLVVQRRQEFHRRVGEMLETIFAGHLEQECELLAYHFGRSDDQERAIHYLDMAGRRAQGEFANETAVAHYSELLDLLAEQERSWQERFDVLARRQKVYGLRGQQDLRQADLEAMLDMADLHQDAGRRSDALNELADFYSWTSQYGSCEQAAREALALKSQLGDCAGQAAALHQLGVLYYYRGDYGQARPFLEQAVSLRQEIGDPAGATWSLMYLGMIHFFQGDYGRAAEHHQLALDVAQARQDWFQEGIHLTNAARVSLRLGEYEQALEQFQRSLQMKTRVGDRTGQGFSHYYMGLARLYLDEYEEAARDLGASLALRQEINDGRGTAYSLYGLGLVALRQCQIEAAAGYFQQAYDRYSELGLKAEAIVALSYLAQAHLAQNRLPEAEKASSQAVASLAEQKNVEEVQQVYFNHYRVAVAAGWPQAGEILNEANRTVMDQAARIGDEAKRQAFLSQVHVNREIRAALKG